MTRANRKHILITGASRGLGATLAKQWAMKYGNHVKLSLIARDLDALERVKTECERLDAEIAIYSQDLNELEDCENLIEQIDHKDNIDLAILNCGVTQMTKLSLEPVDKLALLLNTNLISTASLATIIANKMLQRKRGQIAFINSVSAFRGLPLTPGYCASKAGLKAFSDSLRGKLEPQGLHITSIHPGFIDTNMTQSFMGPKPSIVSTEKIAPKIINAIEKKRAVFIYPLGLGLGQKLLNLLPARIGDRVLHALGYG